MFGMPGGYEDNQMCGVWKTNKVGGSGFQNPKKIGQAGLGGSEGGVGCWVEL